MASDSGFELVITGKTGDIKRFRIPSEGELVLGKDAACQVVIPDERVSRRHALVRKQGTHFVLEDLSSLNGTKVNGAEIQMHFLQPGDEISLGGVSAIFQRASEGVPLRRSQVRAGNTKGMLEVLSGLLAEGGGDPAQVYERMLDGLITAFDAERGAVFVPQKSGSFDRVCTRFKGGAARDGEPISQTLVANVAAEGKARLLTSVETEELKAKIGSIARTIRSIVVAPLPIPGGPGVVYLDSALDSRKFEDGDLELLLAFANAAGTALRLSKKNERMAEFQRREVSAQEILANSAPMRVVLGEIGKAASTDVTVLVTGETGTGKELVARALHRGSSRANGPFVPVNCAAIPSELVESELFGHEKGAFSGAHDRRLGRFELADGGTLFLDEVGELPLPAQGKLLRALQERVIERVGGATPIPVSFRLVAATNVDLQGAVASGKFREDLYYRIAVFPIPLPALRDRGDDVCLIADAFLRQFAKEFRRPIAGMDDDARKALRSYPWPGNIRELRNVIEQAVVRSDGPTLTAASLLPAMGRGAPSVVASGAAVMASGSGLRPAVNTIERYPPLFDEARKQFEKEFLTHKLTVHKGNIKATAEAVGLTRRALYLKCEEYGIDFGSMR